MKTLSDFAAALYNYKEFPRFLQYRKSRIFGFGVLLMTVYFLATVIFPIVRFQVSTGGIYKLLNENLPDFELHNGILQADEVYEYEDGNTIFIMDTTGRELDFNIYFRNYTDVIILTAEQVAYKSSGDSGVMDYSDLGLDINRQGLIEMINNFAVLFGIIIGVIAYFWMWGTFFLGILFLTLIAMIISSSMKLRLRFGQIYALAVYSRTLPILLKAVVKLLPIAVPFFWVLNFGISLAILAYVFSIIKTDVLRQQEAQRAAY